MKAQNNPESPICFDVDGTLVIEGEEVGNIEIVDPHTGDFVLRKPHMKHIKLLKDHASRGYYVIVWSGNGKAWADAVVTALGLKDYVNNTMTKPVKTVDDMPTSNWMPNPIYLEDI